MTTYQVSRETLANNIRLLKKQAGDVPIWAVVKGDGYGLGIVPLAEVLSEEGIDRFCVTEVHEAALLRENGFAEAQILMLRATSDRRELNRLMDLRVILTVGSTQTAEIIDQIAAERADIAPVHIKIDTGMGRFGFLPEESEQVLALYRERKHLAICGMYTHFNCAFADDALTRREFDAFQQVVQTVRAAGLETGTVHCCNSSAFFKHPEMYCDGVRLGSAILGRLPFRTKLRPVGFVQTQIDAVRTLPKGHSTGYGAVWRAKKETKIAILPVGWYHGFRVSAQPMLATRGACVRAVLSNCKRILRPERITVEIKGIPCPVVGAVGMLHCAVDVTAVPCAAGDPATLPLNPLHRNGIPVVFR